MDVECHENAESQFWWTTLETIFDEKERCSQLWNVILHLTDLAVSVKVSITKSGFHVLEQGSSVKFIKEISRCKYLHHLEVIDQKKSFIRPKKNRTNYLLDSSRKQKWTRHFKGGKEAALTDFLMFTETRIFKVVSPRWERYKIFKLSIQWSSLTSGKRVTLQYLDPPMMLHAQLTTCTHTNEAIYDIFGGCIKEADCS